MASPDPIMDAFKAAEASLSRQSDNWYHAIVWATAFVASVVMEIWAEGLDFKDKLRKGKKISCRELVAFSGAILVVLAVAAEGVAEYNGADIETKLRGNNEAAQGVLTARSNAATADAVALTKSFGGLHDFVTNQENLNTAAREELQHSTDSLNKARDEALAADRDAKQTAAAITAANAPREFSKEQHDKFVALVKQLPTIPTSQVVLYSVVANRDAERYANLLSKALSDAHLNLLYASLGRSGCLECVGVWVWVQANALPKVAEDGKVIRAVFAADGVNVAPLSTDPQNQMFNPSTIVIIVGPKS